MRPEYGKNENDRDQLETYSARGVKNKSSQLINIKLRLVLLTSNVIRCVDTALLHLKDTTTTVRLYSHYCCRAALHCSRAHCLTKI